MDNRQILESWKEIAAYLRRTVRSCQKWERGMGLPVHRLDSAPKARVYAYKDELDRWLEEKLGPGEAKFTNGKFDRNKNLKGFIRGTKFIRTKPLISAVAAVAMLAVAGSFLFRSCPKPGSIQLGRQHPVTREPGLEIDPAISPDGNMIAYAAGPLNKMCLYVRAPVGGHKIALTENFAQSCRWPQWSPDGTKIAFQSGGSIYVVPYLGGFAKKIVEGTPRKGVRCAAWSPDGKQMCYVEGRVKICVVSLDGGEPRTLIEPAVGGERVHSLAWSPDGSQIAYVQGNWDYLFSYELGNIAPSSIWMVPYSGGNPIQITDEKSLNMSPVWIHGGRRLLYVSNKEGSRDIYLLSFDPAGKPSGQPVRLTTGLDALSISLSSDGTRLAYAKFMHNANIWSVSIPQGLPISLSEARPVTTGNQAIEGLDVSSDCKWLAYDTNLNGNQDIYRLPLAEGAPAGEPEQLTTGPNDNFFPAWSPDGTEIAFYSFSRGNRDIFLMKADGTRVRQLTDDPAQERYPHWSPDGLRLVFGFERPGSRFDICVMARKSKDSEWRTPRLLAKGWNPKWSPDGRLIVYLSIAISKDVRGINLEVISPEGGEPRMIFQSDQDPSVSRLQCAAWAPDGRTVYFKSLDKDWVASIWSMPVAGGKPRLLVRLARLDDLFLQSPRDEFATDGHRFYFILTKYEADIWQMDLSPGR